MSINTLRVNLGARTDRDNNLFVRVGAQLFDHANTPLIPDGIGLTIRDYGLHEQKGFVIFLDILGMKGIWKRFQPITVIKMWNDVIRFFSDSLNGHQTSLNINAVMRVLSDTIIITVPSEPSYRVIDQIFNLLLEPFINSIRRRMLIRGVISYGRYYLSDKLIIGPALDDAAYNHDKLDWLEICLSPSLSQVNDISRFTSKGLIYYTALPHKGGLYQGIALNWPANDPRQECFSVILSESKLAPSDARTKYVNTTKFHDAVMQGT